VAESGFLIDGVKYEIPLLDSLNMREAKILYDCCGLSIEDFMADLDDPKSVRLVAKHQKHPGFWEARFLISYLRGNPDVSLEKARDLIDGSNFFEVLSGIKVDDADPPDVKSSSEPSASGAGTTSTSSDRSGTSSTSDSEGLEKIPEPTGTTA
jgi:hypothetical protein